jgi:hypothetical protein
VAAGAAASAPGLTSSILSGGALAFAAGAVGGAPGLTVSIAGAGVEALFWLSADGVTRMLTLLLEKSRGLSGVRKFLSAKPRTWRIWWGPSPLPSRIVRALLALSVLRFQFE